MRVPVSVRFRDGRNSWIAQHGRFGDLRRSWEKLAGLVAGGVTGATGDKALTSKDIGQPEIFGASAMVEQSAIPTLAAELKALDPALQLMLDPAIGGADVWPVGAIFGQRRHALDLIGVPLVPDADAGRGVNVVILDQGLDAGRLRRDSARQTGRAVGIAGGWSRYEMDMHGPWKWYRPGEGPPNRALDHAHMVARNVLSIAPAARIWDVPLLPDRLVGPSRIAVAEAIFWNLFRDLVIRRVGPDTWSDEEGTSSWVDAHESPHFC